MHGLSRISWLHSHVWVMGSWGFGIIPMLGSLFGQGIIIYLCLGLWSYLQEGMRMARAVMEMFPHGWVVVLVRD